MSIKEEFCTNGSMADLNTHTHTHTHTHNVIIIQMLNWLYLSLRPKPFDANPQLNFIGHQEGLNSLKKKNEEKIKF